MFLRLVRKTEQYLREFVEDRFDIQVGPLIVETPPKIEFGDLAFPFPFELAKSLRRAPRKIAAEVVEAIEVPPYIDRYSAAGAGYVNVFFKRIPFFEELFTWLSTPAPAPSGEKVIVEHTNINPNKAAHIGHLRNAALGDAFVRILRALGQRVEVQNYIDNTGVQVADVVAGFQHLRRLSLEEVRSIPDPFDYYCWDLYAEVTEWYARDESRIRHREETLQAIEHHCEPIASLAEHVAMRIVQAHLRTMLRIGVQYELLPRESEILALRFWEDAFEQLKERRAIVFRRQGRHQGCWVMELPGERGEVEEEKIIVRSNGTVTYVGKDIAYQLWKFGLLGKTFHYRPLCRYQNQELIPFEGSSPDEDTVWVTTSTPTDHQEPDFGKAHSVYNVIDVRQSYLQRVVVEGLHRLGFQGPANRSIHFSYEMVALSPACCAELGIELADEDKQRPYVEVSGRKGLGVKADELIDKLIEKAREEVDARQQELPAENRKQIARHIAVGALRYFLLKYSRNSVIAFDFGEALNFEGETGPYLQYSVVRAKNIFRKLEASTPRWNTLWGEARSRMWQHPDQVAPLIEDEEIWSLLLQVARLEEVMSQALQTLEISHVAKHAFNLAQQFNLFYHKYHILSEEDPVKKYFYLTVADATRQGLLRSLDLMGIQVPERM